MTVEKTKTLPNKANTFWVLIGAWPFEHYIGGRTVECILPNRALEAETALVVLDHIRLGLGFALKTPERSCSGQ